METLYQVIVIVKFPISASLKCSCRGERKNSSDGFSDQTVLSDVKVDGQLVGWNHLVALPRVRY